MILLGTHREVTVGLDRKILKKILMIDIISVALTHLHFEINQSNNLLTCNFDR